MKRVMEEEELEKQTGEERPVRRKIRGHATGGGCAEGAVCMRESVCMSVLLPRGHLAMSGNIFACFTAWGGEL